MAITLITAAICGIGIGILSALLGVGGGIITIPLLRLIFGIDSLIATGTSLFVVLPTSISGVIGRIKSKTLHIKISLLIGAGGVIFSPLGSTLADIAGGTASMIAAAIVIAYTGANMVRKALKKKISVEEASADELSINPRQNNNFILTKKNVILAITVGIVAGFLSGFIGVGGGFIITPMMMALFNSDFKNATGISLLALCILSIPGIITHGFYGNIDYLRGAMIAVGSIPGAFIGSALLKRIKDRTLRIAFGILLVVVAIILALNEIGI